MSETFSGMSPEDFFRQIDDRMKTFASNVKDDVAAAIRSEVASTIKSEIAANIAPLRQKQNEIVEDLESTKQRVTVVESESTETKAKVSELEKQLILVQRNFSHPNQNNQSLLVPPTSQLTGARVRSDPGQGLPPQPQREPGHEGALAVLQAAKKVLGFSPITLDDIEFLKNKKAISDDNDAMKAAIIEFLNDEMKIPSAITDKISITKVFTPASQPSNWNNLYAEFSDTSTVELINQYVSVLRPGISVSIYVPNSLFPRFCAVRDLEYSFRNGAVKHKTRIKYGVSDFVLLVKPRNQQAPWSYPSLASLPPLQLSPYEGNPSSSPPTGRVRLNSKRLRSESPISPSNQAAKQRREDEDVDDKNTPARATAVQDEANELTIAAAKTQEQSSSTSSSLNC